MDRDRNQQCSPNLRCSLEKKIYHAQNVRGFLLNVDNHAAKTMIQSGRLSRRMKKNQASRNEYQETSRRRRDGAVLLYRGLDVGRSDDEGIAGGDFRTSKTRFDRHIPHTFEEAKCRSPPC